MFLNQGGPVDTDSSPSANPEYEYNFNQSSGILITGTNTLSVYLNNYGDSRWGSSSAKAIHSDMVNDPDGSSFIEVNYSITPQINYGLIVQ